MEWETVALVLFSNPHTTGFGDRALLITPIKKRTLEIIID